MNASFFLSLRYAESIRFFYLFDGRIRGHDVNRCLTSLASIFVSLHMSTEVCNVVLKVSFVSLVDF